MLDPSFGPPDPCDDPDVYEAGAEVARELGEYFLKKCGLTPMLDDEIPEIPKDFDRDDFEG